MWHSETWVLNWGTAISNILDFLKKLEISTRAQSLLLSYGIYDLCFVCFRQTTGDLWQCYKYFEYEYFEDIWMHTLGILPGIRDNLGDNKKYTTCFPLKYSSFWPTAILRHFVPIFRHFYTSTHTVYISTKTINFFIMNMWHFKCFNSEKINAIYSTITVKYLHITLKVLLFVNSKRKW